jgi:hypothetical protein
MLVRTCQRTEAKKMSGVLRLALFLLRSPARLVGAMIEESVGFFDESGTHASAKILALGGWIASIAEWESFQKQWDKALRAAGASTFRFADFDNSRGVFEGWGAWRKENLITELFKILRRHDLRGVSAAIVMPEYREVVAGTGSLLEEKHSPYVICQQLCIELICKHIPEKVFCVFEDQREFRSFAVQNYWDTKDRFPEWASKMSGIAYRPKTQFAGLQAADLLIYETAKSLHNRLFDPSRPIRKSMKALIKAKGENLIGEYFDKDGAKALLQWNPPDRTRFSSRR